MVREDYKNINEIVLPDFYDKMLEVSKELCSDFPFVRVDFFIANGRFYFSKLTFTPSEAMMPLKTNKYDLEWGNILSINKVSYK